MNFLKFEFIIFSCIDKVVLKENMTKIENKCNRQIAYLNFSL